MNEGVQMTKYKKKLEKFLGLKRERRECERNPSGLHRPSYVLMKKRTVNLEIILSWCQNHFSVASPSPYFFLYAYISGYQD